MAFQGVMENRDALVMQTDTVAERLPIDSCKLEKLL